MKMKRNVKDGINGWLLTLVTGREEHGAWDRGLRERENKKEYIRKVWTTHSAYTWSRSRKIIEVYGCMCMCVYYFHCSHPSPSIISSHLGFLLESSFWFLSPCLPSYSTLHSSRVVLWKAKSDRDRPLRSTVLISTLLRLSISLSVGTGLCNFSNLTSFSPPPSGHSSHTGPHCFSDVLNAMSPQSPL